MRQERIVRVFGLVQPGAPVPSWRLITNVDNCVTDLIASNSTYGGDAVIMVAVEPQEQTTRRGISVPKLLISIVACEAIGGIGSIFTFGAIPTWYSTLQKPSFTPPNWLFAPIWITLFALMGISLYLIWRERSLKSPARVALIAFALQLALNVLWSAVFFGLHEIFLGLVEILVLWAAIAFTIIYAFRLSRAAAYLLVPYIAWVTIATLLNYSVWILNV